MSTTPTPAGFDEIQRDELSRLFRRVIYWRLAVVPAFLSFLVWLALHPTVPWRRAVLFVVGVLAIGIIVHEVYHHRRYGLGRRAFAINFTGAAIGQIAASFATGGLGSPVFFAMFPITLIGAVVAETRVFAVVRLIQLVAIWGLAYLHISGRLPHFIPRLFGGDVLALWKLGHGLVFAFLASMGLGAVTWFGRSIRRSFNGMLRRGLEAREEILRSHAERARELAALSGEIAHELKNPLASVKGLAALLAQDAASGKSKERLDVLRREVDRMQAILDEFLNFSRPVVPLSIENVDVAALARAVAEMHEGLAYERGVRLQVTADSAHARCDPRKIEQAFINVVQNAIEASPAGAAVEIEVRADREIEMQVLDRGTGIEQGLGEKVFEPGVTTKPHGSGLGLTIARALVRQHGGELTLTSRAGGGCVAILRLPKEVAP